MLYEQLAALVGGVDGHSGNVELKSGSETVIRADTCCPLFIIMKSSSGCVMTVDRCPYSVASAVRALCPAKAVASLVLH